MSKLIISYCLMSSFLACTKKVETSHSEVKVDSSPMHSSSEGKPLPCKDRVEIVHSVCLGKIKCGDEDSECRSKAEKACKKSHDALLLKCR